MSAAGLLDIKRRIKTVQSTQKITRAMALVSTSKLRVAKENLKINNKYLEILNHCYESLLTLVDLNNSNYGLSNKSKKNLYIVFSSNSGLCGSFNAMGIQYLKEKYNSENTELIIIGEKGKVYGKKFNLKIHKVYSDFSLNSESNIAIEISNLVIEKFKKAEVNSINLIYSKNLSAVKDTIVEEKLLPIENNKKILGNKVYNTNLTEENLLEGFLCKYIEGKIVNGMINSKVSEESSRMNAMNSATKNGDEILLKLKIKYNRIRQSAITQEISEIIGGAEAQR